VDTFKVNNTTTTDGQEDSKHNIQVNKDSSKSEHGVGSGIATFKDSKIIGTKKYRLNGRCSKNQAEQLAILKALENIKYLETNDRTVQISTDWRITIESLKNRKNHTHLIEKIRTEVTEMDKQNWKIEFNWTKAQEGHHGNEFADQLQQTVIPTSAKTGSQNVQRKVN
jgi:ribonuclease HI